MSSDVILEQSLRCLWSHFHRDWGDRYPLDVFNRLLAKNIRPTGWTKNTHMNIEAHQISSRQEQWTTADLAKLPRGHSSSAGMDVDCPVVVAEYDGVQRLLDGNHRINRWMAAGDTRLHDVNIHTVAGTADFVELPSSASDA